MLTLGVFFFIIFTFLKSRIYPCCCNQCSCVGLVRECQVLVYLLFRVRVFFRACCPITYVIPPHLCCRGALSLTFALP
jgi:hypothetical protein